jgi:hypothetical protein
LESFDRRGVGEPDSKVQHGGSANLGDPRFRDTENKSDLLHADLFVVVKSQDQALAFGQVIDRPGQTVPHLPIQVAKKRIVFWSTWHGNLLLFV